MMVQWPVFPGLKIPPVKPAPLLAGEGQESHKSFCVYGTGALRTVSTALVGPQAGGQYVI